METKKVGFLGLGNMGFPMASNLMKAGYTVYGVDVNKENEKRFAEIGGMVGFTSATLASEVNIIFTSLPTPKVVEDVYLGIEGLVENGKPPLTLIDLSTISPELNKKVAKAALEKGIQYLGAPVSGSVAGAEAATLSVMVGGDKTTYGFALPYLETIGKNIFHVGEDHGLGTIVKLINNLMAGIHTQAVAEALSIADAAGLDHEIVYRIVNVSTGQSGIFTRNYKNFIAQDEYYEGAFTTALLLKDLKLANHVSNSFEGKLPLGEELVNYLESNIEEYADKDISSAYLMLTEEKVKLGK
ncbi:NAD(P)-dependent oxidoreductase [Oceanobacillus profundus]|uniref:NAD(P)-dependent oxidoreductase n=1 Tax=Oceanobacillus TaxID=182709 RepID=UPI0026E1A51E|nr:NAD(P)-dependent oxidoreductase [Oceanobacillus profundus]MBR3118188.1 NAD(P)-dependent oxidoreductase [Oceanobacillus sp.]MDO6450106.1 NAD(P)-dependent oxidoreductase [Oceanobacillus profundus]